MDVTTESVLDALWREHSAALWRAVFAYAGDSAVASDAVAEAFAQCLARGQAVHSPKAWLWQAAFKIAAGELQRGRGETELAEGPTYKIPERAWELISALRALPERQRAAIVLHYYADRPTRDIAEILGCSAATVRVHLSQGRKRLRQLLEDDDA